METIWFNSPDLSKINLFNNDTLVKHLGINITQVGNDYMEGQMPVDSRTHQPFGLLHGGASCVLAESLGSIAANLTIDNEKFMAVGQHIEATHLRPVKSGFVFGKASIIHKGRTSQLWRIEIMTEEKKLVCDSKILMAIIPKI